jgi:flagellar basal-body rod protein FlgC
MQAMEISRSGLDVEWRRLEVIAQNIANVSTTTTATGQPYRGQRLVSGPRADFAKLVSGGDAGALGGVMAYGVEPLQAPPRRVYDPQHPNADAQGFVTYPGIDQASEMTLMLKTSRAYEANIVAMNAARQMYSKALDIGKRA